MLNINYNKKIGLIKWRDYDGQLYNVYIYGANCLGAYVYEYTDGEGVERVQLLGFWNDRQHLRAMLGLTKDTKEDGNYYKKITNKIEIYGTSKEARDIFHELTKAEWNKGTKITNIINFK